jgi:hypothetical protein
MAQGSDHFVEAIGGKGAIAAHGVISIPQASYKTTPYICENCGARKREGVEATRQIRNDYKPSNSLAITQRVPGSQRLP